MITVLSSTVDNLLFLKKRVDRTGPFRGTGGELADGLRQGLACAMTKRLSRGVAYLKFWGSLGVAFLAELWAY
jgi:hypothetical protein